MSKKENKPNVTLFLRSHSPTPTLTSTQDQLSPQIKEIIYNSAVLSTAHAIPYIFKRKNHLIRVLWALCLLACTGVCAWMITTAITGYFAYESVTKIENVLEIPTTFPTISICNMNPFVTSYSLEFVQTILGQTQDKQQQQQPVNNQLILI